MAHNIRQLNNHHGFRQWLGAWSAPSHYLNQWWNIFNWTSSNKLRWNFNQNSYIFVEENAFENVVWKMASIFLGLNVLTHWGRVPHNIRQLDNHPWFRQWLVAWSAPSHFLNQCWNIVNYSTHVKTILFAMLSAPPTHSAGAPSTGPTQLGWLHTGASRQPQRGRIFCLFAFDSAPEWHRRSSSTKKINPCTRQ